MKKNLFDYFNSSQEVDFESSLQDQNISEGDVSSRKENIFQNTQLDISFGLSEIDKGWSSDIPQDTVKKVKKDLSTLGKNNKQNEDRYEFLVNIKDKFGRDVNDENYDKSTLFISENQLSKLTPFERQFWEIKKDYFDTIVFFKKGKFYELYEDDADISAKLFNMKVTERVNMRMTGFPESSYDEWVCKFLETGYNIARVEQSENAIGKQIREKGGKKDKIINRELVEVVTQGTIYDMNHIKTNHSTFLCAIKKHSSCTNTGDCKADNTNTHFSILLYDSSTSCINSSTFCDDQFCTSLRGYFYKYPIMEYLSDIKYDFGSLWVKADTTAVISDTKNRLNEEEFMCYCMLHNYLSYLKREDSLKNIKLQSLEKLNGFLKLETSTIVNMELFNTSENTKTLFTTINYCTTPGGERMLRNWLLHPFCDYSEILVRQNLSKLLGRFSLDRLISKLSTLGDSERLLSKIHKARPTLKDLNSFLEMIKLMIYVYDELEFVFEAKDKDVKFLKKFMDLRDQPKDIQNIKFNIKNELKNKLDVFMRNYKVTKDEILPDRNNKDELNVLLLDKEKIDELFLRYLEEYKSLLKSKNINYKSIGKEIYQIEVPRDVRVPDDWYLVSTTKSTNRYYTKKITELVREYVEIEERIFQSQGCLLSRAVNGLLENSRVFEEAIRDISSLDCLISFSKFNEKDECCTPRLGVNVSFKGLRNPIYPHYIPNDYEEENRVLVLTGSNMSGKSTFMRSLTLNIILFQMGLGVCASEFISPLFDRLFTRIGASDNLGRGESTFMVELLEISSVLRNATDKSFVVVDELGRGTSIKDGKSIAKAVVNKLKKIQCRVLFSTHYHCLIKNVSSYYMNSKIVNNELLFLYKLKEGECEDSNGIYVAKLAGVPSEIVDSARIYKKSLLGDKQKDS